MWKIDILATYDHDLSTLGLTVKAKVNDKDKCLKRANLPDAGVGSPIGRGKFALGSELGYTKYHNIQYIYSLFFVILFQNKM